MSMPKVLATAPIDQIAIDMLEPFGDFAVAPDTSEGTLISMIGEAIALVVRGVVPVTAGVIEAAPHLKVIGRSGVGYNNIAVDAATARKIPVVYTPGAGARAVAEASMAMMLALCKRLAFWDEQFKAGNWNSRYEHCAGDLDGAVLGIIGLGRIGQILVSLAQPFAMQIVAYDPFVPEQRAAELDLKLVQLDDLLSQADFIAIHCAVSETSTGLLTSERLKKVKRGAILVNLARGEVIESLDVLYDALRDGRLSAVGLDVFAPEPPDLGHPLFTLPNCLTAPHALGATAGAMSKIFRSMAQDMIAILNGKPPRFVVNPEVL